MMRRIAVVGDELEDGGAIAAYGGPPCSFGDSGHQVALIGGRAFCAACRSTGTIVKTGGPRRMFFMGEVALDGDVVFCDCPIPRRIVATRAGNAWYEDTAAGDSAYLPPAAGRSESATFVTPEAIHYDELLIAKSQRGPLVGYPYFVETPDGRGVFGHTDAHGCLPRISTIDKGILTVYWGDEALAKHLRDENA